MSGRAAALIDDARVAFDKASAAAGSDTRQLIIASHTVQMQFAGEALVHALLPALGAIIASSPTQQPDLRIWLWCGIEGRALLPAPLWTDGDRARQSRIHGLNTQRHSVLHEPAFGTVTLIDHETNEAWYFVHDARQLPHYERAAPMRGLLADWLGRRGCQLVHAAAVATEHGALLLTGPGGSGKSTTALRCLRHGMRHLGDDWCLVGGGEVHPLYATAKTRPQDVNEFDELMGNAVPRDSMDEEKAIFFIPAGAPPRPAPLRAIVLPRVTGVPAPTLLPVPRAESWRAMGPSTMGYLPGADASTFQRLAALAQSCDAFRLELGGSADRVPALLSSLLAGTSRP